MIVEIIIVLVLFGSIWLIIAGLWKFIRNFFHNNYSFFDVSFVIAYFVEQVALILLLRVKPEEISLWVSLFALLVVTTASVQKLSGDSRDRKLRDLYALAKNKRERTMEINDRLIKENKELENQIDIITNILEKD